MEYLEHTRKEFPYLFYDDIFKDLLEMSDKNTKDMIVAEMLEFIRDFAGFRSKTIEKYVKSKFFLNHGEIGPKIFESFLGIIGPHLSLNDLEKKLPRIIQDGFREEGGAIFLNRLINYHILDRPNITPQEQIRCIQTIMTAFKTYMPEYMEKKHDYSELFGRLHRKILMLSRFNHKFYDDHHQYLIKMTRQSRGDNILSRMIAYLGYPNREERSPEMKEYQLTCVKNDSCFESLKELMRDKIIKSKLGTLASQETMLMNFAGMAKEAIQRKDLLAEARIIELVSSAIANDVIGLEELKKSNFSRHDNEQYSEQMKKLEELIDTDMKKKHGPAVASKEFFDTSLNTPMPQIGPDKHQMPSTSIECLRYMAAKLMFR